MNIQNIYEEWLKSAVKDPDLVPELKAMNEEQKEDAFYRDLSFGTGGMRGLIGAGTNRMNVYTITRAAQGLAGYVKNVTGGQNMHVAIAYDSRIKSKLFARCTAEVLASQGIQVHIFPDIMPTPCLSYAIRRLSCAAGAVITASHNPASYNGYKVYDGRGCQITDGIAGAIQKEIAEHAYFEETGNADFDAYVREKKITFIPDEIVDDYIQDIRAQSVLGGCEVKRDMAIIYSPLNGTGRSPVLRVLKESGFTDIRVVREQEEADGNFTTCPYPNPEEIEAMELGLEYCRRYQADLLLATDPDADRCGIAVRKPDGSYVLLSANETGVLLLDYICARRMENGTMPAHPVFLKTIVTTDLAERIAQSYGVTTKNVLTGFKYIGEEICRMEDEGHADDFICGIEESYGYLTGTYVRDKDAVNAAHMIAEMFAFCRTQGIGLYEKLQEIYSRFGFCLNTLHSYKFEGSEGMRKMNRIMEDLRSGKASFPGFEVKDVMDYQKGIDGLPRSNVLKFILADGTLVVRPSGTEPKLKVYCSITADNESDARKVEEALIKETETILGE